MSNLTYNTIAIADLNSIDFTQVEQTSTETIRKSIDKTQFVIKWETQPSFITDGTVVPLEVLNYEDAWNLVRNNDWQNEPPLE